MLLLSSLKTVVTQQERHESPTVTLTWHASKHKVHKLHQKYILITQESPTVTLTWHASKHKVHKLHHRCVKDEVTRVFVLVNVCTVGGIV